MYVSGPQVEEMAEIDVLYLENITWKNNTKWEESLLRLCVSFFSKELTMGKFNVRTSLVEGSL